MTNPFQTSRCTLVAAVMLVLLGCGKSVERDRSSERKADRAPGPCESRGLTVLVELDWARYLALDGDYVYWADPFANTIGRVPKCGGSSEVLGTSAKAPYVPVVQGDHVYTTVRGFARDDELVRIPKTGGAFEFLAAVGEAREPVAADSTAVFWGTRFDLYSMPLAGGSPVLLAHSTYDMFGLIPVDDAYVYSFDDIIVRVPKGGGEVEAVAEFGPELPWCAQVDDQHIYWTEYIGEVYRAPKAGGDRETLGEVAYWRCMTLDATHGYFARDDGYVSVVDKSTLATTVVEIAGATDLKVDEHYVYATIGITPGAIVRIEKPVE